MRAYVKHSPMTNPGVHAGLFSGVLPGTASAVDIVRSLLIHDACLHCYDLAPDNFATFSRSTLPVETRLAQMSSASRAPLTERRPPANRQVGTCRDFALLTCSLVRAQATPARVRCGFATYFPSNAYADHWVCEVWDKEQGRWLRVDAQLDEVQQDHFGISFDTLDVPRDTFLTASEMWHLVQTGAAMPTDVGSGNKTGEWFLCVNIVRDRLALNDIVVSQWDTWRDATSSTWQLESASRKFYARLATDVLQNQDSQTQFDEIPPPATFWKPRT